MAKLYFYYSTMNAGKSTALLQASHNYGERGMRTLVYTAQLDDRGGGRVHSRIGISGEARHFSPTTDLFTRHPWAAYYWTNPSSSAATKSGNWGAWPMN